jgi:hypothetical protein
METTSKEFIIITGFIFLIALVILSNFQLESGLTYKVSKDKEDKIDIMLFEAAFPLMKYHEPMTGETNGNIGQD